MLVNDVIIHIATVGDHFNTIKNLHHTNKELVRLWSSGQYQTKLFNIMKETMIYQYNITKHADYLRNICHINIMLLINTLDFNPIYHSLPDYNTMLSNDYNNIETICVGQLLNHNTSWGNVSKFHIKVLNIIRLMLQSKIGWLLEYNRLTIKYPDKLKLECVSFY